MQREAGSGTAYHLYRSHRPDLRDPRSHQFVLELEQFDYRSVFELEQFDHRSVFELELEQFDRYWRSLPMLTVEARCRGNAWNSAVRSSVLAAGVMLGACFSDPELQNDCTPGTLGCTCTQDTCESGLSCQNDYCMEQNCDPGTKYCRCSESGECFGSLACVDNRVCIPPQGGETDQGDVATDTHGQDGSATSSSDSSGTGDGTTLATHVTTTLVSDSGLEVTGISVSDTVASLTDSTSSGTGGATSDDSASSTTSSGETCMTDADCGGNQFVCDFPDGSCGAGQPGICIPRPTYAECVRLPITGVTGCDGQCYDNECEAHAAGTDANSCTGSALIPPEPLSGPVDTGPVDTGSPCCA